MTDNCKAILNFLGCDYELFENEPEGKKIVERRDALWTQGQKEGFIPLLIPVSDTLAETIGLACEDTAAEPTADGAAKLRADILQEAESVDVEGFLAERLDEYLDMHKDDDVYGAFQPCEPMDSLSTIMGKNEFAEIILAKIPTKNPWELAAWLPMGGFNDCPLPAEQTAVFKRWYEQYGAVPALVTYDIWELKLCGKEPVCDEAGAEALAKEQFAFCYDIVMQSGDGFASIRGLASLLKGSHQWYFWWD